MAGYNGSLEIRPITERDLEDVLEVYRQCEDFLALGPEPKASMTMVLRDIDTSRDQKSVYSGIYALEGRPVGIVDFVLSDFEGVRHIAFISLLMIVATARRHGLGTKTLELVENKIRIAGRARVIHTTVQLNNPEALRFWQKNGYRVFGNPEHRPDHTVVLNLRKDLSTLD